MKNLLIHLLLIVPLFAHPKLDFVVNLPEKPIESAPIITQAEPNPELKQKAFEVLRAKCNVCHKKKNPFKVFSLKNMNRHSSRIYKQVFVYKRMPKGNEIQLTEEEYQVLENWLKSMD